MPNKKIFLIALIFSIAVVAFAPPAAMAKGNEYDSVVKHLKTKYRAKKVKIPFMWLARLAVGVVRPAGVKSFSVTLFENLQFSRATLDAEMQAALSNSFSADWSPVFRIRSRQGEQVYMYIRESGASVKMMLVKIDKRQAAIVRATFNPEKLADFINNPKIFGISLEDDNRQADSKKQITKPEENIIVGETKEETKKDN